jgi:hypothetical protein
MATGFISGFVAGVAESAANCSIRLSQINHLPGCQSQRCGFDGDPGKKQLCNKTQSHCIFDNIPLRDAALAGYFAIGVVHTGV